MILFFCLLFESNIFDRWMFLLFKLAFAPALAPAPTLAASITSAALLRSLKQSSLSMHIFQVFIDIISIISIQAPFLFNWDLEFRFPVASARVRSLFPLLQMSSKRIIRTTLTIFLIPIMVPIRQEFFLDGTFEAAFKAIFIHFFKVLSIRMRIKEILLRSGLDLIVFQ